MFPKSSFLKYCLICFGLSYFNFNFFDGVRHLRKFKFYEFISKVLKMLNFFMLKCIF